MRLQRTALIDRVASAAAQGVVVLEAPAGYGKSWLLRKVVTSADRRCRATFGPDDAAASVDGVGVVIDDAHLLDDDAVDRLVEHLEVAHGGARLVIAGRLIPEGIHDVVQLVDGLVLDAAALSVDPAAVAADVDGLDLATAEQVVEASGGCVRVVRAALEQSANRAAANPVALTAQIVRDVSTSALHELEPRDQEIVGLLARSAGIDRHLLARLGGHAVAERLAVAGIPIQRDAAGTLDLATPAAYRAAPVGGRAATELAFELSARDRAAEALSLLLDAGEMEATADLIREQSESLSDAVDPRQLLGFLGRLGGSVDSDHVLLLVRAAALSAIGRFGEANQDIAKAGELAELAQAPARRRVQVEAARVRMTEGRIDEAVRSAEKALVDLGVGEGHTYARAHEILAECAAMSEARVDLQRAAEEYHTAIGAWEACGEHARARSGRRSLAMGVLVALGRIDEALVHLTQLLLAPDLSELERSWIVLGEGFVLASAGRLDTADERFRRIADLGVIQENPRLSAAASWGRAVVASCHGDLDETLRWLGVAENTALDADDSLLSVQFLLDASIIVGALGELDLADRYLARGAEWESAFGEQAALARFVLDARGGVVGDVDAQLAATAPNEWWRVLLVSAHARARAGQFDDARRLSTMVDHELRAMGFDDAVTLGERREHEGLRALLRDDAGRPVEDELAVPSQRTAPGPARGKLLLVIGSPMAVRDGATTTPIPPGNPQRLVGVVVAHGGSASFDQIAEAIWPGDDVEASRARLRNVLLRLRKAVGEIVVRSGNGVRLAPDLGCDLHQAEQLAGDALASLRADPDLAGSIAERAVEVGHGVVFADFEYEEWATVARHAVDQRMIAMLDLLSVRSEDAGDLSGAQAYAERALRLDRYADSRYVRLSELLVMQGRRAAATAVLEDAAAIAHELDGAESDDDPEGTWAAAGPVGKGDGTLAAPAPGIR